MTAQNQMPDADAAEDPPDPRLTELVAYLDGELDEDASSRVEKQLAQDPPLRHYAEKLDGTWKLLDSLGEATASGAFTQKTLESLTSVSSADEAAEEAASGRVAAVRWLQGARAGRFLLWFIPGFLATTAAAWSGRHASTESAGSPDVRLLQQLDLFRDYQRLWSVPGVEFLREITAEPANPEAAAGDAVAEPSEGAQP